MKINMEYDSFTASPSVVSFVEQKVGKLDRYFDRIIDASVLLKNDAGKTKNPDICEIRLNVPNDTLFASGEGENIERAIVSAADAVSSQLKRHKEKMRSH